MASPFMQFAPLLFTGMTIAFVLVLGTIAIADARRS
jgi:hypothetical protein